MGGDFDAGGGGMATTPDNQVLRVFESGGEAKIAKTAAGPLENASFDLGEDEGGAVVVFGETAGNDADEAFVPGAGGD